MCITKRVIESANFESVSLVDDWIGLTDSRRRSSLQPQRRNKRRRTCRRIDTHFIIRNKRTLSRKGSPFSRACSRKVASPKPERYARTNFDFKWLTMTIDDYFISGQLIDHVLFLFFQKYLYPSRHLHAKNRKRTPGGTFDSKFKSWEHSKYCITPNGAQKIIPTWLP